MRDYNPFIKSCTRRPVLVRHGFSHFNTTFNFRLNHLHFVVGKSGTTTRLSQYFDFSLVISIPQVFCNYLSQGLLRYVVVLRICVTSLLQPVQQAAVPNDSVSTHCYSRYSRLQYQMTQSHLTATAGTTGCSTK